MINGEEMELALFALERATAEGAGSARVSLSKSTEDLVATLDGRVDKVTHCADRSLNISLFIDGRFGNFSTNKLSRDAIADFVHSSVAMARALAPDPCRKLPDPARYCDNATEGDEMGIFDSGYGDICPEDRIRTALDAASYGRVNGTEYSLVSEEGEYSDSEYDLFIADTAGMRCRHRETCFDYGVEVTIEDRQGNKYSDYWWTSSPFREKFNPSGCGLEAVRRASTQIGSKAVRSGKYNMVISSDCASRMVSPLLNALNAYSIQQNNSFLAGSLGKQVFPEGLTIMDLPHIIGQTGSKLFDSEGVATKEAPIIEKGCVSRYFVNTYMSEKLGIAATTEEATRPRVMPWPEKGLDRDAIMALCGDGILVTDFNGGNSNSATGDFSYGISGQLFRNGKAVKPVSEMLVTGNFIELWKNLIAVGDDARPCMSKLIPTLAFAKVDFNG